MTNVINKYKSGSKAVIFLFLSLAVFAFSSCGGDEDIDVSFRNPSLNFQPADSDQSYTAQLRREFQSKYGSYLLFTDTLQHIYQGKDYNGNPVYFTERLDIDYTVGNSLSTNANYYYTLIQGDSLKKEAVDFLESYILTHFTGKMKPYSWFLCMRVNGVDNMGKPVTANTYSQTGQRAAIVAFNYILSRNRTEAQKRNFANRVINGLVYELANNNSDAFGSFYTFCSQYYAQNFTSDPGPSAEEQHQLGFINTGISSYISQQADLQSYVQSLVGNDYDALQKRYAAYPVILQKLAICRQIMTDLGFVF